MKIRAFDTRRNRYSGGEGLDAGPSNRIRQEAQHVDENGGGTAHRNVPQRPLEPATPRRRVVRQPVAPTEPNQAQQERRRMRWDNETNKQVMRSFFTVTALETDMTMYRMRLHNHFIEKIPHLNHLSEQRIADQRRAIIRNNLLPPPAIEQIRAEVEREINQQPINENPEIQEEENRGNEADLLLLNLRPSVNNCQTLWEENYQQHLTEFRESDPAKRPALPKLVYTPNTRSLLGIANQHLEGQLNADMNLEEIQLHVYCAALATIKANKQKILQPKTRKPEKPRWEQRLCTKIENLRKHIGRIQQIANGRTSKKLLKKIPVEIKQKLEGKLPNEIKTIIDDSLDTWKQKLAVASKRLKRYQESYQRNIQNSFFSKNQKGFYRSLDKNPDPKGEPPKKKDLQTFWEGIWSDETKHHENTPWIKTEIQNNNHLHMEEIIFTEEDLKKVVKNLANWKAPGNDGIQNFWYKKLTAIHHHLTNQFNTVLRNPEQLPDFLTNGVTYLLPKSDQLQDPSQYRPITCLPTMYKIFTAALCEKLYAYLETNNILTEEQKGCKKKFMGCKEQITIDNVILEQIRKKNRNLYMAYIDYQKAFDSVPHSWLIKTLEIYNVHPVMVRFLKSTMSKWTTKLRINLNHTDLETEAINIKRGIFQGDSLSALWFCLCLNPLSRGLNRTGYGATLKVDRNSKNISHLFFMDDLKIYAACKKHLDSNLKLIHQWSTDIGMSFGMKKCQTVSVEKGKLKEGEPIELEPGKYIEAMTDKPYKYLGILQTHKIEHKEIKAILNKEFEKRLHNLLKSKLNSRNLTTAINSYAISALQYSFGIVKWTQTDLEAINRKIRTELTKYRKHHPKASVERVNLPREKGGRGIRDVVEACTQQIIGLRKFFRHQNNKLHQAIVRTDTGYTPLNLSVENYKPFDTKTDEDKILNWRSKELHGRFPNFLQKDAVDQAKSVEWLKTGTLFPETEGFMVGIQDQVIKTRNYQKYILKEDIPTDRCRKCNKNQETIEHILASCQSLAETKYLERHNKVATIVYLEILKELNLDPQNSEPYYKYKPPPVIENQYVKIYWDKTIMTDVTVRHNRPDITIIKKQSKEALLIDISIPNNSNIEIKYNEKLNKYAELKTEIKEMWNLNEVKIVPVVLSCMGLIPKKLSSSLKDIDIPEATYRIMQKSVILDATNIVRSFLE